MAWCGMTLTYCETNVSYVLAAGVNLCFPSAYPTHTPHLKPLAYPSNVLSSLTGRIKRLQASVCISASVYKRMWCHGLNE